MREDRELEQKKRKKAERGKATMFGWNIGTMSTGAKFLYGIFISAVIGAAFWYLYNRVQKNETSHRKKADKKK